MRKLKSFIFISLDGFYKDKEGDTNWHNHGEEENEYAAQALRAGDTLLFGRVTYEMMESYWPTSMAISNDPVIAEGMNKADKIVFSRTLKKAGWNNTTLIKDDLIEGIKKIKNTPGADLTLLGSGSIFVRLAEQGLIDEIQLMVDPVVLGSGTPLFNGIHGRLNMKLISSKTFKSGVVLLCYKQL